jgi:hypothetical protein
MNRDILPVDHHALAPKRYDSELLWPILYLAIFAASYLFSRWLLSVYVWGDQQHYANFWQAVSWAPRSEWTNLQIRYLSSVDYIYSNLIGLGTYITQDRIGYISVFNAILMTLIAIILKRHEAGFLFWATVFSNFYMLVILSSAERLKFAYLLIAIAFFIKRPAFKLIVAASSVFAHTQAVVQFLSGAIYYVAVNRRAIFNSKVKIISASIFGPVIAAVGGYVLFQISGDVIADKSEFYTDESRGLLEIIQWLLVLIVGVVVFINRFEFALAMLPMGVMTAFYGSRINVATLALFCALALTQQKTRHPLVVAIMLYMSYKSIGFILNVLETGQGFSG